MLDASTFTSGIGLGTTPPLRRVVALARGASLAGFSAGWVVDHFMGFFPQTIWDRDFSWAAAPGSTPHAYYDYQALMGHLATRKLHLAVGVTEPIRRHPVLLAQFALTMSHLARKAPILGVGLGERENVEPYGLPFDRPAARLEEALAVLRLCLTSNGPIDFDGEFYHLDRAVMDLAPKEGNEPQIWVAAHGPRMLRLTGQYGDGWYPTLPMTPGGYEESLRIIRSHAQAAGRDGSAIVPGWQLQVVIGKTTAEAEAMLDTPPARFMALLAPASMWTEVGADHPFGPDFRGFIDFVPTHHSRAEIKDAMRRVDPDLMRRTVLWGTPDQLVGQLHDYLDAGLRHLVMAPISALVSRSDALFSVRSTISIQRRLGREFNGR